MRRNFARLLIALAAASVGARAAAPGDGLVVNITAPVEESSLAWHSQAHYSVTVTYDGKSSKFGEIPPNLIVLRTAYAATAEAARREARLPEGVAEISRSNCSGCHDFTASSAGPSFAAIAKRYASRSTAIPMLAEHIRSGSHGNWGSGSMPPHPDLTSEQASAIAQWIITEADDPSVHYAVGTGGSFRMDAPGEPGPGAGMALSAFYTGALKPGDKGKPSSGRSTIIVHGK